MIWNISLVVSKIGYLPVDQTSIDTASYNSHKFPHFFENVGCWTSWSVWCPPVSKTHQAIGSFFEEAMRHVKWKWFNLIRSELRLWPLTKTTPSQILSYPDKCRVVQLKIISVKGWAPVSFLWKPSWLRFVNPVGTASNEGWKMQTTDRHPKEMPCAYYQLKSLWP